jgi:hypothetical protein
VDDRESPWVTLLTGTRGARDRTQSLPLAWERAEELAARPWPDAPIIGEDPAGHLSVSLGGL